MKHFSQLMKEEVKASNKFAQDNPGLRIGDDFPEILADVLHSDSCAGHIIHAATKALASGGVGIQHSLMQFTGEPGTLKNVVTSNMETMEPILALLYWGIQIGRKDQQKNNSVTELEKLFSQDADQQ